MTGALPSTRTGTGRTTLVLMHFFGSARTEWTPAVEMLADRFDCVTLDLPGFGGAAAVPGYGVAEMADAVAATVEALNADRVVLAGHSMSGKVAAVLAGRGMPGLAGLVLVAPSPPSPEPIAATALRTMLAYGRDGDSAAAYLDANTAMPLTGDARNGAVTAFGQASPAAWSAWLTSGSQEDWAERVGTLAVPTLLVCGTRDASLGMAVQRQRTLPHLNAATVEQIGNCGHVVPLEAAGPLAGHIGRFVHAL